MVIALAVFFEAAFLNHGNNSEGAISMLHQLIVRNCSAAWWEHALVAKKFIQLWPGTCTFLKIVIQSLSIHLGLL